MHTCFIEITPATFRFDFDDYDTIMEYNVRDLSLPLSSSTRPTHGSNDGTQLDLIDHLSDSDGEGNDEH